jgi:hypothetical protein
MKAVADDEASLQEWIYDAYIMNSHNKGEPPKTWEPKYMQHIRANH